VLGYLIAVQLFSLTQIEARFPKLSKYFKFYKSRTLIFVFIDVIIGIIPLLFLVYVSLGIFLR
jgi:hypothetical protein